MVPVGYGEVAGPNATPDALYRPDRPDAEACSTTIIRTWTTDDLARSRAHDRAAKGEWDLSDTTQLHAEALLNCRTTTADTVSSGLTNTFMTTAKAALAATPAIQNGWVGAKMSASSPTGITNHNDSKIQIDYQRYVLGAARRPALPQRLAGTSRPSIRTRMATARTSSGTTRSRPTSSARTQRGHDDGLSQRTVRVDINWYSPQFMAGQFTDQESAFLFGNVTGNTVYEQKSVEAYASGDSFELAGRGRRSYRRALPEDSIDDQPAQAIQDGQAWAIPCRPHLGGEDTTTAVYGDGVLILKDVPFADKLQLTLSGRYTDVTLWSIDLRALASTGRSCRSSACARRKAPRSVRRPFLSSISQARRASASARSTRV